jgi:hypothetical protein
VSLPQAEADPSGLSRNNMRLRHSLTEHSAGTQCDAGQSGGNLPVRMIIVGCSPG